MTTDQTERTGTVFDIGYQSYAGEREGRSRAWQTIFWDGVKNGMGIGRGGWAKFLPWLVVAPTIITGLVFAAIAAFFEQLGVEVDTGEGVVTRSICPATKTSYPVSRFAAPYLRGIRWPGTHMPRPPKPSNSPLLRQTNNVGRLPRCPLDRSRSPVTRSRPTTPPNPLDRASRRCLRCCRTYSRQTGSTSLRFVGNSAVFAIFAASFTFAVSSLTDRRMIATLIVVGTFMISTFAELIIGLFEPGGLTENLVGLVNLIGLNSNVIPSIFFGTYSESNDLNVSIPIAWIAFLTAGSVFATWRFYSKQR